MESKKPRDPVGMRNGVRRPYGQEQIVESIQMYGNCAALALDLTRSWGMVAGKPGGEDSGGREKLALLTPQEVVDRACETAELLIAEFESRNWLLYLEEPK